MVDRWKEGSFSQEQSARFCVPELWTDTRIEKAEPASAISGLANKWKIMFARPFRGFLQAPLGRWKCPTGEAPPRAPGPGGS